MRSPFGGARSKFHMYVRWRVLMGLGTIFWLLLCLTDDHGERRTNEETVDFVDQFFEEEVKNFPVTKQEEPPAPVFDRYETHDLAKVVFWNIVAFLSTLCACFTLKCISARMIFGGDDVPSADDYKRSAGRTRELAIRKYSSSRIPIPVVSKSSSIDIHIDTSDLNEQARDPETGNKSCPNLLGIPAGDGKRPKDDGKTKKIWSIRIMERHCARLREEMVNLQATSLKEHASITKRTDALAREKRELSRQLSFSARENKALRQQIDDMLEERTLLIKRLECATREIKANTKSKRAALAKLDETMAHAENFKSNLEQITRDKVILEDKLMILDAEYKRLKEELALYKHGEMQCKRNADGAARNPTSPNKEHAIDVYEVSDDNKTITSKDAGDMDEDKSPRLTNVVSMEESDFDISRSEKDMKKVQQKLITLERSLENFKMRADGAKVCDEPQQENCDLWPVNENDRTPFSGSRSQSRTNSGSGGRAAAPQGARDDDGGRAATPRPPPSPSRSASSLSGVCSDEQCARRRAAGGGGADATAPQRRRRRARTPCDASAQSICTEPACALEHDTCANAECFLLQRGAAAAASASANRDNETTSSSDTGLCRALAKEQITLMCQRPIRYLRTTVSDDRLSAISEKMTGGGGPGDDSGDEFEPKRKIFTNTPEFQKLLKEILDPQRQSSDEAVRETDDSEPIY